MLSMTQAIATLRRKMLTGNFLSAMLELMVPITMTEATHVRRQTMRGGHRDRRAAWGERRATWWWHGRGHGS